MLISNLVRKLYRKVKRQHIHEENVRRMLLEKMPRSAVCAEIGVWKGAFSRQIIEVTKPKMLHLIDPWKFLSEFPERKYGGKSAADQADMDLIYQSVKERLGVFNNVSIHRGYSEEILQGFKDSYFDWLYIDGNHYYDYIMKDLDLAYKKVRRGGYITGDDYTWGAEDGFPVKRAVQDFVRNSQLAANMEIIGSQFIIKR